MKAKITDANFATLPASFLDPSPPPLEIVSKRGYTTITGWYEGVRVSLIAIGMGFPMMDMMMREIRAVTKGDLVVIRFGSCGSLRTELKVGDIGVPKRCMTIMTNYDHWHSPERTVPPFVYSAPIAADPKLHRILLEKLNATVASPTCSIHDLDLHASADCFYASQGRQDASFSDDNESLLEDLQNRYPDLSSLEMETAHLFHLSRIASPQAGKISAAAHMIFAGRSEEGGFIDPTTVERLEPLVGKACLETVVRFELGGGER